jgi:hypothetical protein
MFSDFTLRRVAEKFRGSPNPPLIGEDRFGRIVIQSRDGLTVLLIEYMSRESLAEMDERDRLVELSFGGYLLTLGTFDGGRWTYTRIHQHPELDRIAREAAEVWRTTSAHADN